ncbi:Hsp20/alpha crystallin family protein [bacterium]|nr:Hsp20/alpha crystallin family protein [bacterium]
MLWDLLHDMRELQNEIDGLFEWPSMLPRLYYTTARSKYPAMNLRETEDNLFLDVNIPGLEMDKVQINIKDHILSINGQKPSPAGIEAKNYHRRERTTGSFIRAVELPMDVEIEKVTATYENGILTITLPKAESAKPKLIEVKVK